MNHPALNDYECRYIINLQDRNSAQSMKFRELHKAKFGNSIAAQLTHAINLFIDRKMDLEPGIVL